MKTRLIVVLLGFLGSGMFVACRDDASDKDDDRPGKAVELAFQAKYPGATGVEWESKGVFREADFTLNGREYEAWFNISGIWLQAEYAVTYTSVPVAIKDFIANSIDYPPTLWTPDAATEVLERKNYPDWYAVELENGANEVTIWADAEAYLHRAVVEDYSGNDIPQTILTFVTQNYRQALLTEVGKWSDGAYQANMLDGNEAKQIYFDRSMNWQYTEWPVLFSEVPAVVKEVLNSTAYENYTVRSVDYRQFPQGDRYHFVLTPKQQPGLDMALDIDLQGNIITQ